MKYRPGFQTLFWLAVLGFVIYTRGPQIQRAFQTQGQALAPAAQVLDLEGRAVQLPAQGKRLLIFWATWCGPCRPEMARIDRLVKNGSLKPENVFAISTDSALDVIRAARDERAYSLPIFWDARGELARIYGVQGTPTIVLLDSDNRVEWMTMGLSPTLELRLAAFFRE